MIYERAIGKETIFYVIPVKSILGKLPVVPVGDTGTIRDVLELTLPVLIFVFSDLPHD